MRLSGSKTLEDLFDSRFAGLDLLNPPGVAVAPEYKQVQWFREGLAAVQVGEKWGFIDRTGVLAIAARFQWAAPQDCPAVPGKFEEVPERDSRAESIRNRVSVWPRGGVGLFETDRGFAHRFQDHGFVLHLFCADSRRFALTA